MKRITSLAIAILLVCGLSHGQEAEEPNIQYENLKVLEPIIGTWHRDWGQREDGSQGFTEFTYSWSPTKKMILGVGRFKVAASGEDLSEVDWGDGGPRTFFCWNQVTNKIEYHYFAQNWGNAYSRTWIPKGDGVFTLKLKDRTIDWGTGDVTASFTAKELKIKQLNRKNTDGEGLDDEEQIWKRVEPEDDD